MTTREETVSQFLFEQTLPVSGGSETYDLILHVTVELVNLTGRHQVVPLLLQRLLQKVELVLDADSLAVHLLGALPLLAEHLRLTLQLLHLLLTHLHLALQDLQEDR